ncbi:MAG: hypothetical protein EOM02_07540 [Synergistales bacterium]|nr:hypothetical protein [Synergistales bacterium]
MGAPVEPVMLAMAGVASITASALMLPISEGSLDYYENGLLGLILFFIAVQMVILGKGPFGDVRRNGRSIATGVFIGALGIVTCFIPDLLGPLPKVAISVCLGVGGAVMLVRLCIDRERLKLWIDLGGVFRRLPLFCGSVYSISMLLGFSVLSGKAVPYGLYVALLGVYGLSLIALSSALVRVYRDHPPIMEVSPEDPLDPPKAMMLLVGVFMVLLGLLLMPVSLGLLPFSSGAQLGLLMSIFAVQILAFGNTPVGAYTRSPAMVTLGLMCAVFGTASCMVPDLLVAFLVPTVGVLNLLGGAIGMARLWKSRRDGPYIPILRKLRAVQVAVNLFSVLFGTSMLVSGLLPGTVIGVILALNGATLLYLLRLLVIIDDMIKNV